MNLIIAHTQEGLERLPQSIRSAIINQTECIEECNLLIASLESEISDLDKKIAIAKDIGMPCRSLNKIRTIKIKAKDATERSIEAYKEGFMEIPELGDGRPVDIDNPDKERLWHKSVLPTTAPLRVFEDLKAANETGLFDEIIIYEPKVRERRDPIIAGRIGRRVFLIANWR